MMPWWKSPLPQILLFAAALAVLQPAYWLAEAVRGRTPLAGAEIVFRWSLPVVQVLWIMADDRQYRRTPYFDYGYLLLILWPFSLFWYCSRTRGWRGLGLALGLVLLTLVPLVATALVSAAWMIGQAILYG
jgi:hypothetical protein